MKKIIFNLISNLVLFNCYCQNNIIPNYDLEAAQSGRIPLCDYFGNTVVNGIDLDIQNWRGAIHSIEQGEKDPDWVDLNSNSTCTAFPTGLMVGFGNQSYQSKIFLLKAQRWDCSGSDKTHEAVCVSLENNEHFSNNTTFIIRYKISPAISGLRSSGSCDPNHNLCHMRIFLSELGHIGWHTNSSSRQELINANYTVNLPTSTTSNHFTLQEREFTTNSGNYTTLVLYMESGAVNVDDIEVFEKCSANYLIQKKIYDAPFYSPNKINFSFNFYEKSSNILIAGNNITNTKPIGQVLIKKNSSFNDSEQPYVTYTAPNSIILKTGFKVESGAHFRAILASCPNNLSRPSKNDEIDSSSFQTFGVIKFDDLQTIKLNQRDKKTEESSSNSASLNCNVFPNPTTGDLNVMMFTKLSGNYHFLLEELTGKVLIAESKMILQGSTNISLKLTGVANGMYVLKILDSQDVLLKAEKIIFEN